MAKKVDEKFRMGEMSLGFDSYIAEQERLRNKVGIPVIGISRHRIGIDGKGVTTLVAFHGCPLRCKYCLNPEALGSDDGLARYKPETLLERVKIDDVYFRTTGGGICFGGGEPTLQTDFITRFKELCPPEWKITIETSLYAGYADLKKLAPIVDEWIVDIKADDPDVYEKYTGQKAWSVPLNLKLLTDEFGVPHNKFIIRVPVIPGFVSEEQARKTAEKYSETFPDVQVFTYVTDRPDRQSQMRAYNANGKEKCEFFKSIRRELAQRNGIDMPERECSHEGGCPGTCPLCDYDLKLLTEELAKRGDNDCKISDETIEKLRILEEFNDGSDIQDDDSFILEGMDAPYENWENLRKKSIEDKIVPPEEGQIIQGEVTPPDDTLPPGIPEPAGLIRKKVLFKECAVAGVSFHLKYDDDLWDELEVGTKVALVREKTNKHDKNAVAIALADDYDGDPDDFDFDFILGYVPKSENELIARMLDMGWNDVFVAELSTVKHHGKINDRLRISIYIQSKEPEKPETIRVYTPHLHEWVNMIRDLEERGTAHFRWGGFPPWEHNLPKLGSEFVVAHSLGSRVVMFKMRVIAKGDDCIPFVDDPDIVNAVDDCVSFILANTIGPVIADKSEIDFIDDYLFDTDYETELPFAESEALKQLFHKQMWKYNEGNIDCDPSIDAPTLAE